MEALADEYDPAEIAAAALQMLWQSQHSGPAEAAEEMDADGERPEAGMTRLFVGMGRQDGLRPGDLVGAITQRGRPDRHAPSAPSTSWTAPPSSRCPPPEAAARHHRPAPHDAARAQGQGRDRPPAGLPPLRRPR